MNKALKILSLLLFGSLITANTLNIEPDGNEAWNVNYTSNEAMGGFQFNVQGGSLNNASGGDAEANGFMISTGGSMVLGFSLTGSTIPAGEGTLVVLDVSGTPTELYNIVISDSDGNPLDFTFVPSGTAGCTDDSACNYNEEATIDDGACSYPDEGFNCDGNPAEFTFNQSTLQAPYFFVEVTIDGNPIESNDWVGAFNGNICVGARQWNTAECGGGVCEIMVMGNDGTEYTQGYCNTGDLPSFKIYDTSTNLYYNAYPTEEAVWVNNGFNFIDGLSNGESGCTDPDACNYNPDAIEDDGTCTYAEENYDCDGNCTVGEDCAGECSGSAVVDECGVCGGDGVNQECGCGSPGEFGIPNGDCDCEGNVDLGCGCGEIEPSGCDNECGSTLEFDECGECGGDNTSCADCAGIPNGDNVVDNCSTCDNDPYNDCIQDCAGEWGGSAIVDECGECNGDGVEQACGCGSPGEFGIPDGECNCLGNVADCAGECGGNTELDECGICGGFGADIECWDGSYVCETNDCPNEPDECMDDPDMCIWNAVYNNYDNQENCEENGGIWGGYLEYFNTSCEEMVNLENGCEIQILYWTVSDLCPASCGVCCDDEDACNLNGEGSCEYPEANYDCDGDCTVETDCAGVCGGSAIVDECGECGGDGVEQACGCGSPDEFGIPDGDCDCEGNVDLGCGCGELGPSGCDNECGSNLDFDECGVCGGDNSSCEDCAGVPNGDSVVDNCGTCDNDPSNDCVQDCNGEWGGSAEEDECGVCDGYGTTCLPEEFQYNSSMLQAFYYLSIVTLDGQAVESEDWVGAFNGDICVGSRKWDTSVCNSGICDVPAMGDDGNDFTVGYMQNGDIPTFKIYDASEDIYYDAIPSENFGWANFGFYFIENLNGGVFGCMDEMACNYDPDVAEDDGSCEYAMDNYNCDGNCVVEVDCAGECGGSAELDDCDVCTGINGYEPGTCYDCNGDVYGTAYTDPNYGEDSCTINECVGGNTVFTACIQDCADEWGGSAVVDECEVCNGDGPLEGFTCDGIPILFDFNQSTLQAFYYFNSITLHGVNIEADDWVAAFNGDICVGSRQWDTSLCNSGVCDLPVMGDDDSEWTAGYMQSGDTPTYKIFDASNNEYFEALASENFPWVNNELNLLDTMQGGIFGCMNESACNFVGNATVEDGSCTYAEENYDCDGNCLVDIDCEGVCGGTAIEDECGICGGDGAEEGFSCDGTPLQFVYNQSSSQAFYYIHETNDLLGDPLTSEDWVGVFNGDVCVGSRKWVTSVCNSGICDVPAMGDDGYDYSEGYLLEGDYPNFKIYDYSEGEYFDVYPSENYPFENNAIFNIDELVLDFSYSIPLHQYNNLVSFYVLPEDNSVSNVMLGIQNNISYVIGESESAQLVGDDWTGSLTNLDLSSGYWLNLIDSDTLDGSGHPLNPGRVYNLHSGANLVSFPSPGFVGISAGLPDEIEDNVIAIIGEGFSTINTENGWLGSVLNFEALHGYWIITNDAISFSYELDSLETLSRSINLYKTAKKPLGFDFIQSSQQAFYFVDNVELIEGEIEKGDWIISYCGNTVTGSRIWLERTVDIPVMGAESTLVTAGYCEANDTPNFKLYKSASQELISLHADIPEWQSNGIFQLNALKESAPIPTEYGMGSAYPNPFNPITQIGYEIPAESHIEISVFDLRGQKVATLVNEFTKPGAYSITWDAANIASGVYFVHFTATGEGMAAVSQIQKLMLIK